MKARHSSTSSSETPGRTALRAAGWAVAVVIAVDLLCRSFLPRGGLLDIEDFIRHRAESESAPDVQVVGDSVARSGVLVTALTGGLVTGRNDAIPAGGTPKTYLLLARQFETGHVPKVLVIAHSPHTFGQIRYEVLIGSFAHWREVPELLFQSKPWTDGLYGVLTRFSYMLMHRDSFADLIRRGDSGFFTDGPPDLALPSDAERIKRFRHESAAGKFSVSPVIAARGGREQEPFQIKPMNDYYFRRILNLAKEHGVKVFWITPPVPSRVIDSRAPTHYETRLVEYLRQFESSGELTILRGRFVEYPDEMFRDSLHLNSAGVVRLACEIGAFRETVLNAVGGRQTLVHMPTASVADESELVAMLDPYCRAMRCPEVHTGSSVRALTGINVRPENATACSRGTTEALADKPVSIATRSGS